MNLNQHHQQDSKQPAPILHLYLSIKIRLEDVLYINKQSLNIKTILLLSKKKNL